MEKLDITHLAPYLPYGLRVKYKEGFHYGICEISGLDLLGVKILGIDIWVLFKNLKPILRPISDLGALIRLEFGKLDFYPSYESEIIDLFRPVNTDFNDDFVDLDLKKLPYECVEYMFKNHYDFFGLIDKGLATSINDFNKKK